jgi:hypothetical protein
MSVKITTGATNLIAKDVLPPGTVILIRAAVGPNPRQLAGSAHNLHNSIPAPNHFKHALGHQLLS